MFENNGHAQLIQITHSHSSHLDILKDNSIPILILIHIICSPIYPSVHTADMHTIDNGSNNTVGGRCYSAHQAVSRFPEHHIDMVSCVHRKCQTRAGAS